MASSYKGRLCGVRKTSTNNAYSKDELIQIAKNKGIKTSGKNMKDLCTEIKSVRSPSPEKLKEIKKVEKLKKLKKDEKKLADKGKKKACGVRNSANRPAYTKQELIEKVVKKGLMTKSEAVKSRMEDLCVALGKKVAEKTKAKGGVKGRKSEKKHDAKKLHKGSKSPTRHGVGQNKEMGRLQRQQDGVSGRGGGGGGDKGKYKYALNSQQVRNKLQSMNLRSRPYTIPATQKCLSGKNMQTKQHQIRVIQHMMNEKTKGLLAIHSTGSGKTITAVTTINCMLNEDNKLKVIIITPKSLQENMKKEMKKFGMNPDLPNLFYFTTTLFYRQYISSVNTRNLCKDALIIIDEAHNLRSLKSKISSVFIGACKPSKKVLLLTATPYVNAEYDIINLIAMVDHTSPVSINIWNNFLHDEITKPMKERKYLDRYLGCKISFYDSKSDKDIENEYPEKKEYPINFEMSEKFYEKYKKVEMATIDELSEKNISKFLTGIRTATNGAYTNSSPKIKWIVNKIESIIRGTPFKDDENLTKSPQETNRPDDSKKHYNKVLVYSFFQNSGIKFIEDELKSKNIGFYSITGKVSKEKRKYYVNQFNSAGGHDDINETRVLIISKAGGEGLDLKGVTDVIILEPPWNDTTLKQVTGRAVRYKSHEDLPLEYKKVNIFYLCMIKPHEMKDDTIPSADEYLYKSFIEGKRDKSNVFMDVLKEYSIEKLEKCQLKEMEPEQRSRFVKKFKTITGSRRVIEKEEKENQNDTEPDDDDLF